MSPVDAVNGLGKPASTSTWTLSHLLYAIYGPCFTPCCWIHPDVSLLQSSWMVSTTNSAFRHYASNYSTEISNDKRKTYKRLFQAPFQYTRWINDVLFLSGFHMLLPIVLSVAIILSITIFVLVATLPEHWYRLLVVPCFHTWPHLLCFPGHFLGPHPRRLPRLPRSLPTIA